MDLLVFSLQVVRRIWNVVYYFPVLVLGIQAFNSHCLCILLLALLGRFIDLVAIIFYGALGLTSGNLAIIINHVIYVFPAQIIEKQYLTLGDRIKVERDPIFNDKVDNTGTEVFEIPFFKNE